MKIISIIFLMINHSSLLSKADADDYTGLGEEVKLEDVIKDAKAGKLDAMFVLGSIAIEDKNYPKAKLWLEKASNRNHAPSLAGLGFMYYNGFEFEKNLPKARELYERSAEAGAHQGLNNLAHLYRYGIAGIKKDQDEAIELLKAAAHKGNEFAVYTLTSMYRGNELGAINMEKSVSWIQFGVKRNYPTSHCDLGYLHEHGVFLKKDPQKAVIHYEKAILLGSADALSNLGYMYLMGNDVNQDYQKALTLFTKAVDKGSVPGMMNLAVMKYSGLGCEKDLKETLALLKRASDLGNAQATKLLQQLKINIDAKP
jgi:TPR repeat protein